MNDVTLTEGSYTHAAILIKNNIGYTAKKSFRLLGLVKQEPASGVGL